MDRGRREEKEKTGVRHSLEEAIINILSKK